MSAADWSNRSLSDVTMGHPVGSRITKVEKNKEKASSVYDRLVQPSDVTLNHLYWLRDHQDGEQGEGL